MEHIFKIKVYKMFGSKKSLKIKAPVSIDEINSKIREQCNGNLVSIYDINGKTTHFDRNNIKQIVVKEVK